jgi:hypothetical protein
MLSLMKSPRAGKSPKAGRPLGDLVAFWQNSVAFLNIVVAGLRADDVLDLLLELRGHATDCVAY